MPRSSCQGWRTHRMLFDQHADLYREVRPKPGGSSGDVRLGGQQMFCGWDWGSTHHGVCVIDDGGAIVKRWLVRHSGEELVALFDELADLADVRMLPIAIERGDWLSG